MNHKRLLMLCYHYPPAVSGGVERSARFAKSLPALGWEPIVVTTNRYAGETGRSGERVIRVGEFLRRRGAAETSSLAAETERAGPGRCAPAGSVASGSPRNTPRGAAIRFAEKWLLIPDKHVRWAVCALIPALRMLRARTADVLYTSSPPASAHALGLVLKRLARKPWVMDLRDPWTLEPLNWFLRSGGRRLAIERAIERACFKNADAIVTSTPEAKERYASMYGASAGKIHAIPNGYDAQEFETARSTVAEAELLKGIGGVYVVSHIGTLSRHTDEPSCPRGFLGAVRALLREGIVSPRNFRVVFAGTLNDETGRAIDGYGLDSLMVRPGRISHMDALRLMCRSDLLLLYDPNRVGAYYVHGKLYEYLASGRPILGVLPEGAARRILERSGRALAVTRDDETEIGEALRAALAGRVRPASEGFPVDQYEGRQLASMLARVLEGVAR